MAAIEAHRRLDTSGEVCPWPVIYTLKAIKDMRGGEVLEVITDNPPSARNIPEAVSRDGHEVLDVIALGEGIHRILIRVTR